jgi:hypothetical protein
MIGVPRGPAASGWAAVFATGVVADLVLDGSGVRPADVARQSVGELCALWGPDRRRAAVPRVRRARRAGGGDRGAVPGRASCRGPRRRWTGCWRPPLVPVRSEGPSEVRPPPCTRRASGPRTRPGSTWPWCSALPVSWRATSRPAVAAGVEGSRPTWPGAGPPAPLAAASGQGGGGMWTTRARWRPSGSYQVRVSVPVRPSAVNLRSRSRPWPSATAARTTVSTSRWKRSGWALR